MKTLLSLFDYTGNWSQPYEEDYENWQVIQLDLKLGIDIEEINTDWLYENIFMACETVDAILAAPPCTDFSVSGAQYWKQKDISGETAKSINLVYQILRIVDVCQPDFFAIENPIGRIAKLIPELGKPFYFQPCDYGDPYTKKTALYGKFTPPMPLFIGKDLSVKPIKANDSWLMKLGGKSEKTKELRSQTPLGFAYAFYEANK